jgi:hypothetical protein
MPIGSSCCAWFMMLVKTPWNAAKAAVPVRLRTPFRRNDLGFTNAKYLICPYVVELLYLSTGPADLDQGNNAFLPESETDQ